MKGKWTTLDGSTRTDDKGRVIYTYRGDIERGPRYRWTRGYSSTSKDGGIRYPWNTKREIQADAKRQGVKVSFEESEVRFAS
jgi:hypothetical protein